MKATITARRVLTQLRHDPRTVVMLLLVPTLLMTLLRFVFNDEHAFSRTAPALLGVFPFVIMFLVASVTTLRERTTATLERLMTMPMGKLDLILGYAIAFGAIAVAQVGVATTVSVLWLGLDVVGSVWTLLLIAVLDAVLGMALGLFVSAFATSEFQAIQFMPLFVLPQFLLCGLLQPRERMGWLLNWLSDVMPLSYAVDALTRVTRSADVDSALVLDLVVVAGCVVAALALGAGTLRRRTA
ncbi:ABC transporter permease [Actinokineospora globicatena]|uniref:ABC transporter permease n=1 Tax=Actinokineospora globicatena TaxID=103729 RepID=UPI0020A4D300|nr:ABC transporter permease [Actinokineospora globicatena]MCP2304399.1 ABC-2 type transport system permease protein [Actinokineospora globicatena]GLW78236.1 transport permease protein [Actinokineospora globicatena]GLW85098.1 transport permease protein [Actinokineospora globicatena]